MVDSKSVVAYFDTNIVEDIESAGSPKQRDADVDADVVRRLREAIADGRLVVPCSDIVAEELTGMIAKRPERAAELGRFYLGLVSTIIAFEMPAPGVSAAVEEILFGTPRQPIRTLTAEEQTNFRTRLTDPTEHDVAEIVAKGREKSGAWRLENDRQAEEARQLPGIKAFLEKQGATVTPLPELMEKLWPSLGPFWTPSVVRGAGRSDGLLDRAKAAGKESQLLDVPAIRTGAGYLVGMRLDQVLRGTKADGGNYGDAQHSLCAAAGGAIFVTRDRKLRTILDGIPGRPLRAMRLSELVDSL